MKELREAKKDQLRRQKADEIEAMRAALKAQAQQRAAKRGKRKDGRRATDPTKASRLAAHKRALVPEQASTVADDEEERPVTAEDPYRGLEPFRLNSAALRILDGERGSSDDEASIASEASTSNPPAPARPVLRAGPVPPMFERNLDSGSKTGACSRVIERSKPWASASLCFCFVCDFLTSSFSCSRIS